MIFAFTGKTGSGKTYRMVKLAYKYWKDGIDIYSNTILFFDNLTRFDRVINKIKGFLGIKKPVRGKITYFEDISEILEAKNGLILFDEAQVLFNARNWEALPYEFQYKLQQHRKHRLDLFCTTQNMGTIDISYRRLVQAWYHHESIFQIGQNPVWLGWFRIKEKDIDRLYNNVDDLMVEDIKKKNFIIHRFCNILYDTMFDIGFRRFRTEVVTRYNSELEKTERMFFIIPKQLKLKDCIIEINRAQQLFYKPKYKKNE